MNRIAASVLTPGLLLAFTLCGCAAKLTAVDEVKQVAGKVTVDENSPDKTVIGVNLLKTDVTDAWLEHLQGLPQLQSLNLTQTQIGDAGLKRLQGLTQLQSLELRETNLSDAGLEYLQALPELQSLNLWGTNVSDAGLERIRR